MSLATEEARKRVVTHERAREAARRLINSHFRNKDTAHMSIPVNVDDDDVVICDYIAQQALVAAASDGELLRAAEWMEKIVRGEHVEDFEDALRCSFCSAELGRHTHEPKCSFAKHAAVIRAARERMGSK